jgi:predicted ATPase
MIFFPNRSEAGSDAKNGASGEARESEALPAPATLAGSDFDSKVQLLVVSGEMGSGKSRLLEEFKHWLKLNDLTVYTGNCYEGTQKAYQPIIEILRQVVYGLGLDSEIYRRYEDSILKLVPELEESKNGRGRDERSFRPEKEKHQFIDTISQFLVEAAQQTPFLAVVNNLQWVDDASVDLLDRIFQTMAEAGRKGEAVRLMVIFSQRSEEQTDERVRELISDRIEDGFGKEILVRRLKTEQIREFLQAMLGFTEVPEDFVQRLEEQTGGSPLFLVETLKALEDAGIIKHHASGWTVKTTKYTKVEIPQSMEDLLLKRIERLENVKRQILEVLGILNKPVSPKLLQQFERFRDVPVLVQLRELESVGIVHKRFENKKLFFEIEQPKVREILYKNLADEDRQQLHGEVGEAYEEYYKDRPEDILEELAYHLQRSNKTDKAMKLALRAGDRLKAIYANEKAHEHYAFVLAQATDEPEYLDVYFDIREKLGDICTTMGRYEEAEEHYNELLSDGCREMLAPDRVTQLFLRRGKVFEIQGDYDAALRYYKEARNHLSAFGKDHQVLDRARVYTSIGWVYVCMGKYEKAMTISLEALRVIGERDEGMEHAKVYSTIGSANFFKGNIQEAAKYHRKSLEIKEALENIPEIVVSLNNLGSAHLAGAEYGEALESFQRAFTTSEEIGDPYGRAMSLHNLARLHASIGELDVAEAHLEDSFRQAKLFNMRYLNLQNHLVRGMILKDREEYTKAEGSYFRVLTAFSKQGNCAGLCTILVQVAELYRLNQNLEEAASMIEEAKRNAEDLGIAPLQARCLLEKARQLRAGDEPDYDGALERLRHAFELAEKGDNPELPGEVAFELAETLVSKREVSQASQFYKVAQERFREVGDSLPVELRAAYENRQRSMFRNWKHGGSGSISKARASASEPTIAAQPADTGPAGKMSPEEALKRVNQLMMELPTATSLPQFLGKVVEELLLSTGAEVGFVLSLAGRNLSVLATRRRGGGRPTNPGKMLCLPLINRALKQQHPLFIDDATKEPASMPAFRECGLETGSLSISPFLESDGKKGALYLLHAATGPNVEVEQRLLVGPFLNILPMAFLQIQNATNPVSS